MLSASPAHKEQLRHKQVKSLLWHQRCTVPYKHDRSLPSLYSWKLLSAEHVAQKWLWFSCGSGLYFLSHEWCTVIKMQRKISLFILTSVTSLKSGSWLLFSVLAFSQLPKSSSFIIVQGYPFPCTLNWRVWKCLLFLPPVKFFPSYCCSYDCILLALVPQTICVATNHQPRAHRGQSERKLLLMHITILFLYAYEAALLKVSFLLSLGYLQKSKSTQPKSPLGEENNLFFKKSHKDGAEESKWVGEWREIINWMFSWRTGASTLYRNR